MDYLGHVLSLQQNFKILTHARIPTYNPTLYWSVWRYS